LFWKYSNANHIAKCDNLLKHGKNTLIPEEKIDWSILLIRGQKVMLDADFAVIYGISTSRLNEQIKRNKERFP
jgi:hypothetical protein